MVGKVIQSDVRQGRELGIPQLVSDGETCSREDEVDQDKHQGGAGLPVFFRELCTFQPLAGRHVNLNLDRAISVDRWWTCCFLIMYVNSITLS